MSRRAVLLVLAALLAVLAVRVSPVLALACPLLAVAVIGGQIRMVTAQTGWGVIPCRKARAA